MKVMERKLILFVFVIVSLFIFAGRGWSLIGLPTLNFTGPVLTTSGIGIGELALFDPDPSVPFPWNSAYIFQVNYKDGTTVFDNGPDETIVNAVVAITGAVRTGDYTFDDATVTITSPVDSHVYFSAKLSNIELLTGSDPVAGYNCGTDWCLNPNLSIDDPASLNLSEIVLDTTGHPSRYIEELGETLASNSVSGMKMIFFAYMGDVTGDSLGFITDGLIDGVPASANTPPVANAGDDITIPSNQVATTTVQGTVIDADAAYVLTCRWTDENGNVLKDWTSVGIDSLCPLDLGTTSLGIGIHTLTLEANDGEATSSDNMILTINNSAPNANAGNDVAITTEEVAATTIQGVATDFDGNALTCSWLEGGNVLQVSPAGLNGECPLNLSALSLGIGTHTLTLEATDGQAASSDDMILTINNTPPIANAGENITITSDQVAATTIQGTATDFDGDALSCLWTVDGTPQSAWSPAGPSGECPLSLGSYSLGLGTHTLTLEATDGQAISSNIMELTINNSAPHAAPGGAGVYEINTPVILPADVSDFDGDMLHYEWADGSTVLCSGDIQSVAGGTEVLLPDCVVSNLSLGMHTISLQVSDGYNIPDIKSITVQIVDSNAPKLRPVANKYILWPPNHKMVDIVIAANASDNSGCPVTLNATVTSNEPQYGLGSGDTGPDWTEPVIDQTTGMIYLQLRAERSGRGKGRRYTITITATDCSGNISTAKVKIRVPHDKDNDDRRREDREERDRDDRHDGRHCMDDRDD